MRCNLVYQSKQKKVNATSVLPGKPDLFDWISDTNLNFHQFWSGWPVRLATTWVFYRSDQYLKINNNVFAKF